MGAQKNLAQTFRLKLESLLPLSTNRLVQAPTPCHALVRAPNPPRNSYKVGHDCTRTSLTLADNLKPQIPTMPFLLQNTGNTLLRLSAAILLSCFFTLFAFISISLLLVLSFATSSAFLVSFCIFKIVTVGGNFMGFLGHILGCSSSGGGSSSSRGSKHEKVSNHDQLVKGQQGAPESIELDSRETPSLSSESKDDDLNEQASGHILAPVFARREENQSCFYEILTFWRKKEEEEVAERRG